MFKENQLNNVAEFKDFLVKNGYSNHVIMMYIRKVKEFLKCRDICPVSLTNYEELKEIISEYLKNIPVSFQKGMIQAALHTYYYFLSGNRFFTRLYASDFDVDMSIEAEVVRFRKYLHEVARLSENTVISQCNTVKTFLYSSFPENNFAPQKMTADHVRVYLTHTLRHISAASKKTIVTRIRSYVRFLGFTDGFHSEEILKLPMTSPVWKRAGLSKTLNQYRIRPPLFRI